MTKPGSAFESDHKCNTADIHMKIAKKKEKENEQNLKYRKPNEQQEERFNICLAEKITNTNWKEQESIFKKWAEMILEAAEETLSKMPPNQKQPYISEESWNLLEQKWDANEKGNDDEVKRLDKIIRDKIRKEKQEYRLAQLEEIDEQGYKWDGIKLMKKKFSPKYCKFKDKDGKHVPVKEYADRAAEYLRDVQWKKTESAPPQNKKTFPSTKKQDKG